MNYGRALKIARALAGLEQKELASRAGVDASHISLIEQGKRNPSVITIEKIAGGLGMPYHVLTLLAAESQNLKNIKQSEISSLAEFIARTLLTHEDTGATKPRRTRPRRRT
jgi:transcriptional regulator with XRE-family HTH domain